MNNIHIIMKVKIMLTGFIFLFLIDKNYTFIMYMLFWNTQTPDIVEQLSEAN